jgi:predicted patatin/cPLA2 family phospholipase
MEPVDRNWVDGGVREQTPLKQAIKSGHTDIIVILCNPITENPINKWKPTWPYPLSYGLRAIDIMEQEMMLDDIRECLAKNERPGYQKINLKVYSPKILLMDTIEFDPNKIRNAIQAGREVVT